MVGQKCQNPASNIRQIQKYLFLDTAMGIINPNASNSLGGV